MSLGENIYNLRKSKKLSQEKLAEKINVTRQTISNWELNVTQPNPEQLKLLSISLEITVDSLLDHNVDVINIKGNEEVESPVEAQKSKSLINIVIMSIMSIIVLVLTILLIVFINIKSPDDNEMANYSVVYDYNNGEPVEAFIVKADSLLNEPSITPQKEGYMFEGWYYNDIKWDYSENKVNSNIIITAKYTKIGDLEVIDSLSAHISNINQSFEDEFSYEQKQILDSRFYILGHVDILNNHSLGNHRLVLNTMLEETRNVSIIGVKVDKPCIIEIKMVTESDYGYTSTLTEFNLKTNNEKEEYVKVKNVGQSLTNSRITTIYYEYNDSVSTILYFGVLDRNMGIFDIKILNNETVLK